MFGIFDSGVKRSREQLRRDAARKKAQQKESDRQARREAVTRIGWGLWRSQ